MTQAKSSTIPKNFTQQDELYRLELNKKEAEIADKYASISLKNLETTNIIIHDLLIVFVLAILFFLLWTCKIRQTKAEKQYNRYPTEENKEKLEQAEKWIQSLNNIKDDLLPLYNLTISEENRNTPLTDIGFLYNNARCKNCTKSCPNSCNKLRDINKEVENLKNSIPPQLQDLEQKEGKLEKLIEKIQYNTEKGVIAPDIVDKAIHKAQKKIAKLRNNLQKSEHTKLHSSTTETPKTVLINGTNVVSSLIGISQSTSSYNRNIP
ncbi:MAG: hypothetical protein P857_749 [Candidatus Xenolissoclinum pacificiensis L6]|uniref:Uncharacterized protein n=1 Tax=Candidatus Xenolissoclinum pacificiensis L6 TaxID=1401685 RepID=W2UZI5_9RICK|nr:MAG: hypothetical protein P857_749 [Candidatus Xenolissoclinum pacificiensis L6]